MRLSLTISTGKLTTLRTSINQASHFLDDLLLRDINAITYHEKVLVVLRYANTPEGSINMS